MHRQLTAAVLAALLVSMAATPSSAFGGANGAAWVEDFPGHFVNTNNPDLRFDTITGRKAIPGRAAAAQDENSADENSVISRPSSTLVDPHRTLE